MKKTLITCLAGLLIGAGAIYTLTSLEIVPIWHELSHQGEEGHGHDDDHGPGKKSDHDGHEDEGHDEHEESNEVELTEEAVRSAGLKVAAVALEKLAEGLDVTAVVEANQDRLAHVGPRIEGSLVEVKKEAVLGGEVKEGQVLAVLDGIELGKAKAAYLKQVAILETAKDRVEKETALYTRLNRIEIGVETIRFLESKQQLEVAQRNYDREKKLAETKASSEQDLLAAQAQFLSAQARYNAAHDKLLLLGVDEDKLTQMTRETARTLTGVGTTSTREKLEAVVALKGAEAELQAACELLYTLGLKKPDIAALGHDHDQPISNFALRAPISGRIVERHATIGEVVESKKSLFVIADLSTVWILLDIYERDIPRVNLEQTALIAAPGLEEPVKGRVTYLGDIVDAETRTIKARVEVKNPELRLKPGMFVQVKLIESSESQAVLLVPEAAVQRMDSETVVFVQEKPLHFEKRNVLLGSRSGSRIVILRGLEAGEKVVIDGSFWLKSQLSKSKLGGGHSH